MNPTDETRTKIGGIKPSDYLAIDLWHRSSGSMQYYIDDQQNRAASMNAPIDATYEIREPGGRTGKWATVSALREDHPFRAVYAKALEERK